MDFLKSVAGKLVTGAVGLIVIAGAISWWSMDEGARQQIVGGAGKIGAWIGVVLLLPWVTFFLSGWAGRKQSNAAGALLVACYSVPEWVMLVWLFNWKITGGTAWMFMVFGMLFAAAYNLLMCDWIAEKVSS